MVNRPDFVDGDAWFGIFLLFTGKSFKDKPKLSIIEILKKVYFEEKT